MTDEERREALSQQVKAARAHLVALYNETVRVETEALVDEMLQMIEAYRDILATDAIGSPREAELYSEIMRIHRDAIDERCRIDRLGLV